MSSYQLIFRIVILTVVFIIPAALSADIIDLVHEFDGNADGSTSYGTIELTQDGSSVNVEIVANTVNLVGGDIQVLYFNLPDNIDINSLMLSNSAGVSNHPVGAFSLLGVNPTIIGGAGHSFDTGVHFGNGGGPPGNGLLTTATFTLTAAGGLTVNDIVSQSTIGNLGEEIAAAIHFQSADVFGAGSETIGGTAMRTPEPGATSILLAAVMFAVKRRRRS